MNKLIYGLLVLLTLNSNLLKAQNAAAYQAQYTHPLVKRILNLDKTVRDRGAIVGMLTAQDLTRLPLGIMDPSGKVVICVDSAKFTPNGATFNAYAAVQLPGMKEKMCFRAINIPMGPNGITAADAPALTLVSTHVLQLGNKVDLVVPGTGGNNIRWDCAGFKEINIEGKFVFKDGFFSPDKVEAPNDSAVTATVKFEHITNINNMMASVSITPFKIRGMEDFGFKVTDATVDFSDHANPANFQFPSVYQNEFGSNINLWRGFFLRNLTVRLPFDRGTQKASLSAMNMLIDESGVTGVFAANNLISIDAGNMNGWAFSVDTIKVELLRNRLMGGSMAGGLNVPFTGNDSLGYRAAISQWNEETHYLFQLGLREDKVFKTPFRTKMVLKSGSYVQVEKFGDKLEPTAYLHGMMGSEDTSAAKFSGIKFENVLLSTHAPYVHSGTFSLTDSFSTPSLAGFNISLNHISLAINNGEARLNFTAGLGFMDAQSQGFGVSAGFTLKAGYVNQVTPVKKQYWEYRGLDINKIGVNVNFGVFKFNGEVEIYRNHITYGNGFHGMLDMTILPQNMNLRVAAQAYFGNKEGIRYFQVSGYAGANTFKVPIIPSVLDLNGFLGGISWHMKRADRMLSVPTMLDTTTHEPITDMSAWAKQTYVPDGTSGLGILVGTSFVVGSTEKLCSGAVGLEVGLNSNWGLDFVELKGLISMFKSINNISQAKVVEKNISSEAFLWGEIGILYDAPNRTLHANAITYLNVVGKVVGDGANNRLGELVLHISPSNWYVYQGRPTSPMGIKMQLKDNDPGLLSVQTYMMVGTVLEPFPPPPSEVLQNISYTPSINITSINQGGGTAFGARLSTSFDFGKDEKSWIYGGFAIAAGADVMLSATGNNTCNNEAVGIGGWWARGQAYAYIQGAVGIRVKVLGKKRKFSIATLAAGLLLEAKIPKPTFLRGFGYVSYNVLGGLVKGKANFKVEAGQDCSVVSHGNDERELLTKVLAGTYPAAGQNNMEVYTGQSLVTNIPVNQNFTQMDSLGNEVTYKVDLLYFRLKQKTNGQLIGGAVSYSEGNKVILFRPGRNLMPDTEYEVEARLAYLQQLAGGSWTPVKNDDNTFAREDTSFTFRTGPPSDMIRMQNIDYAYPFSDMKNFYKDEYTAGGYMKIGNGVNLDNVFYPGAPGSGITYTYKVKIKSASPGNNDVFTQDFTRNGQMLNFAMPAGLQKGNVYRLSLVRIANNNNGQGGNNISNQQQVASQGFGADSLVSYSDTIVNNVVTGNVNLNEVEMFSYHFRVSKYNTFNDKLNSMAGNTGIQDIAAGNVIIIGTQKNVAEELFDDFELLPVTPGQSASDDDVLVYNNPAFTAHFPLIKVVADSVNNWLQEDMYPLVYPAPNTYYGNNVTGTARGNNPNPVSCSQLLGTYTGVVPLSRVVLEHTGRGTSLPHADAHERLTQFNTNNSTAKLVVKYNLPYFMNLDFQQMYLAGVCEWVRALDPDRTAVYTRMVETGGVFPQIKTGTYKVKLTYTLPGNTQSVTKEIDINY